MVYRAVHCPGGEITVLGSLRVPTADELRRHDGAAIYSVAFGKAQLYQLFLCMRLGGVGELPPALLIAPDKPFAIQIDDEASVISFRQLALGQRIARLGPLLERFKGSYPAFLCQTLPGDG